MKAVLCEIPQRLHASWISVLSHGLPVFLHSSDKEQELKLLPLCLPIPSKILDLSTETSGLLSQRLQRHHRNELHIHGRRAVVISADRYG
jgi:hypothetical protein